MKEIKSTIEQTTGYEAFDGERFTNKEECEKYENSAIIVVEQMVQKLLKAKSTAYDLLIDGTDDEGVEIYQVNNLQELELLNRYLYLETGSDNALLSIDALGKDIIIQWWYIHDGYRYWIGIEGILDEIKSKYEAIIKPKEREE